MQLHWSSPNLHNNHRGEEVLIYLASLIAQLIKNPPAMWETLVRFLGWEDPLEKGKGYPLHYSWASLVTQLVKNLPAMWDTWV